MPHHPLVEALASDPNQPPKRATRLSGYPGPAADRKSTRLWLDIDLTSFVDVPDEAILYSRTLADEEGTILWVDPAATLSHASPQPQEVQAEFLAGSIARRKLAGALGAAGFRPQIGTTFYPTYADCPHSYVYCPTEFGGFCVPTQRTWVDAFGEARVAGPLVTPPHQSIGIICQSAAAPCPPEPWTGTPAVNPVGPFRPQQQQ